MLKNSFYVYGTGECRVPANLNFGDYFLKRAWEYKDKPALINGSTHEVYTFGELLQDSMNVAVSLTHIGVRKGDVVAICTETKIEYWSAVIGTVYTGAVLTAINPTYTAGELKHILSISEPRYMFCSPSYYEKQEKTLKSIAYLKKIILFGDTGPSDVLLFKDLVLPISSDVKSDLIVTNRLIRNVKYEEFQPVDVNGHEDVLFILYSSGTTGLPKGVMLTHLNVLTSCCFPSALDPKSTGLIITPWYHTMGLNGILAALVVGRSIVYLAKFQMDLYLSTIEKYKISQLTVVPPVLVAVCKTESQYDLSSVQVMYSGGAPLQNDTLSIVKTKFPNLIGVIQGYGMTEATVAVTRTLYSQASKAKAGSVGKVVPSTVAKVVDIETRKPLGPNQHGELCFKGPQIMKGYIGKDRRDDCDDEGFFKTGDIGYYDEDHYFFIVDRLKELIKYKAYQVPPAEIEALLLQHEAILDACVVGLKNKESGEVPLAFVVKQPGKVVTEKEIQSFVAERLSNPKHLRGGVRFVSEIPKNPSGKILRKELRKMVSKVTSKL
ncbi:uncharacterized protein LOC131855351 [Achroia grisella]|uniref:uncharacterized protein LOC131855351 n=1 Tax=Achroia grisella TaxID=688607 RepID=UPI0027D343C0|nr:uncharacterized protein LOC131855351 [Achroia grisella]